MIGHTASTRHAGRRPSAGRRVDAGFSLMEITISMVMLGMIVSVLTAAATTALRASPDTETRLDDARATRSLATWLVSDTMSTPPFMPEQPQGGIVLDQDPAAADNNDCGVPGTNLLHLQWTESAYVVLTVVANYRAVDNGDGTASILRVVCTSTDGSPFATVTRRTITDGLAATPLPTVTPVIDPLTGNVTSIAFALVGATGEQVLVETGSRNPAEFFP